MRHCCYVGMRLHTPRGTVLGEDQIEGNNWQRKYEESVARLKSLGFETDPLYPDGRVMAQGWEGGHGHERQLAVRPGGW